MLVFEQCIKETLRFQKNILSHFSAEFGHPSNKDESELKTRKKANMDDNKKLKWESQNPQ